MGEPNHNLIVHYKSNRYIVENVDSGQYCHLDMLSDVCEAALNEVPSNLNLFIQMYSAIPGSSGILAIQNDIDLKRMFNLHKRVKDIHVFLKASQTVPLASQGESSQGNQSSDVPEDENRPNDLRENQLNQSDEPQDGEAVIRDMQPGILGDNSSDENGERSGGLRIVLKRKEIASLMRGGRGQGSRWKRSGFEERTRWRQSFLSSHDDMSHRIRSQERSFRSMFVEGMNPVDRNTVNQEVVAHEIRVVDLRAEGNIVEENRIQESRNGVVTQECTENKDSMDSEEDDWAMF